MKWSSQGFKMLPGPGDNTSEQILWSVQNDSPLKVCRTHKFNNDLLMQEAAKISM